MKKIVVALLVSFTLFACSKSSNNGNSGGGNGNGGDGSLSYSPASLDFGSVTEGNKSNVMGIDIKNISSADAVINSFSVQAPFMVDESSTCSNGTVLKSGEGCIFDIAVRSATLGSVTGNFTVNTSGGNFQTSLKALITEDQKGKFITVTDYPAYNARFVVTDDGVIYAVDDNLQVLKYDKTANGWNPVRVENDVMSGFSLEGFSVSALDGMLYVIGGLANGTLSNKVWEFNPANGQWRIATPAGYDYRSYFHTSTTVGDKIYVIGGSGFIGSVGPDTTNFIGVIDPVNGTSGILSSTGFPVRNGHAAAAIGSKIYVFGGNGAGGALNGLYVFDTIAGNWKTIFADGNTNSHIEAREDAVMTTEGGSLYVFGGQNFSGRLFYGDFKRFDTSKEYLGWNDFVDASPIVTPAYKATGVAYADRIYVFGGISDTFDYKNNFWSYDINKKKFDKLTRAGVLTPLKGSASVFVGSDAYLLGGAKDSGFSNEFTKFSLFLRNASDATPDGYIIPPLFAASLASSGLSFYIYGGRDENTHDIDDSFWRYDTISGELDNLSFLPSSSPSPTPARYAAATAVVGNKLYVIGGSDVSGNILNDTWVYDITGKTWENITGSVLYDLVPLVYHSATVVGTKIYVFGGLDRFNNASNKLFVMDTESMDASGNAIWENVNYTGSVHARFAHSAAVIGETIYVFSGQAAVNGDYLNDLWKYDVRAKTWEQVFKPNMPYSYDSGYHMYNENGTLWFLNNFKFDLRYYHP